MKSYGRRRSSGIARGNGVTPLNEGDSPQAERLLQEPPEGGALRIRFTVPGKAVGQPRAIQTVRGQGRKRRFVPEDHPIHRFRRGVALQARLHYKGRILTGPIHLEVLIVVERPKYLVWKQKPMVRVPCLARPDRGNVVKAIEDALNKVIWRDDSQVWSSRERKVYAAGDEKPHVDIEIIETGEVEL
jgi:Holliday junction resolvase RusA-like endonuclease